MKSTILKTLPAVDVDMEGLDVKQALPVHEAEQIDPFLLLHHTRVPVIEGTGALHSGVPPHPHRGFSAVTVVIDGEVHHRDSLGNSSVIGPGGIQWVSAGRGIVHSERPSAKLAAAGGAMDVIQLWVNSPADKKMVPASYHAAKREDLPLVELADGVELNLIAGEYAGLKAKIPTLSPIDLARVYASEGSDFELAFRAGYNAALYIISGKGKIKGHGTVEAHHLYQFEQGSEGAAITAEGEMDILMITGEPLNEQLATYGPFVMNNQTQIMEALRDHQAGKMGVLIEE